ncbi:MAG: hypothetical protein ACOYXT_27925 [Bacteroidota bacterium]
MKKIFSLLMALVVISSSAFANGPDEPKAAVNMAVIKSGSMIKLLYKGAKPGTVKVTIYDNKNVVVFTEILRNLEGFMRPYNFSSLPEGEYAIELATDEGKQVEKVNYFAGKVERVAKLVKLAGGGQKFMLSVPNKQDDVLTIRIFDEAGAAIYDSKETIKGDFAKVYDLNKVTGKVLFEIVDKNGITKTLTY